MVRHSFLDVHRIRRFIMHLVFLVPSLSLLQYPKLFVPFQHDTFINGLEFFCILGA